jgi:hypothetical protein
MDENHRIRDASVSALPALNIIILLAEAGFEGRQARAFVGLRMKLLSNLHVKADEQQTREEGREKANQSQHVSIVNFISLAVLFRLLHLRCEKRGRGAAG